MRTLQIRLIDNDSETVVARYIPEEKYNNYA
jgi:hypothetical protein